MKIVTICWCVPAYFFYRKNGVLCLLCRSFSFRLFLSFFFSLSIRYRRRGATATERTDRRNFYFFFAQKYCANVPARPGQGPRAKTRHTEPTKKDRQTNAPYGFSLSDDPFDRRERRALLFLDFFFLMTQQDTRDSQQKTGEKKVARHRPVVQAFSQLPILFCKSKRQKKTQERE
nr:hypothetical protein [Pandoravirus aubagnensis]